MQLHGPMSGMLVTHRIAPRSSEASECYLYGLASVGKRRHTFLHQNPLRGIGRGLVGRCQRVVCCSHANGKLDSTQRKSQFLKYISEASTCLLFTSKNPALCGRLFEKSLSNLLSLECIRGPPLRPAPNVLLQDSPAHSSAKTFCQGLRPETWKSPWFLPLPHPTLSLPSISPIACTF